MHPAVSRKFDAQQSGCEKRYPQPPGLVDEPDGSREPEQSHEARDEGHSSNGPPTRDKGAHGLPCSPQAQRHEREDEAPCERGQVRHVSDGIGAV